MTVQKEIGSVENHAAHNDQRITKMAEQMNTSNRQISDTVKRVKEEVLM
jgi:hypothetical protein